MTDDTEPDADASDSELMEDVDHESPDGPGADRVFERGDEGKSL